MMSYFTSYAEGKANIMMTNEQWILHQSAIGRTPSQST
jgi:hypothetical protein